LHLGIDAVGCFGLQGSYVCVSRAEIGFQHLFRDSLPAKEIGAKVAVLNAQIAMSVAMNRMATTIEPAAEPVPETVDGRAAVPNQGPVGSNLLPRDRHR
jgi:hypothetical protein